MFCISCGLKNAEDSNFCKQCGQKLEKLLPARITEADFERAMPEEEQVTVLLERAYRARKEGNPEAAIAYCKDALQLRPESTSAHSLLGQLYEQSGDHEQAIREYERVLALNPGSIADRVKLDELRGDVPTAYPQRRTASQIVMAERQSQQSRADFRLPLTVAGALMLMALGGIFALQLRSHDPNTQSQRPIILPNNSSTQSTPREAANSSQPNTTLPNGFTGFTGPGLPAQPQPIIIQTPAPRESTLPPYAGPTRNASKNPPDGNSGDQDGPDHGVTLQRLPDDPDPSSDGGVKSEGHVTMHPGSEAPAPTHLPTPDEQTGPPNAQSLIRIADDLKAKKDYKNAGATYLKATENAGDDRAYAFQNAGWCAQQIGDKTSAISYYQSGKAEAQKLLAAGKQVDNARDLIRECNTGIKVCSNN